MSYQLLPYFWLSLFSGTVSTVLSVYAWKRRNVQGALYFLAAMLLVTLWIIAQALEFSALKLTDKIFWANIQYIPITLAPAAYLAIVLTYTGLDFILKKKWFAPAVVLIPLTMIFLIWTNEYHGLMRQNIYLDNSGFFPVVGKTYGSLFWLYAVYNYTIVGVSLFLLADAYFQKYLLYRKQILFLFIGLLIPLITTLINILNIIPLRIDLTPPFFGLSGLLIAWGIFRYRLFDIMPVARSAIIEKMGTSVMVFNINNCLIDINPSALKLFGVPSSEMIGLTAGDIFINHPDLLKLCREEIPAVDDMVIKNKDMTKYFEATFTELTDPRGKRAGSLILLYDITSRKKAEEMIRHAALHDHLTSLPNRKLFMELFSQELVIAKRHKSIIVVLFIDLDDLKHINDTYGHVAGDCYLREAASKLKGSIRKSDILARIGGDEFALLIPDIKKNEDIENIVKKTFSAFDQTLDIKTNILKIRASVGVSIYPDHGSDIDTLLGKADSAMYSAKKKGKNCYHIHDRS